MLSSISPVGEASRHQRWPITVTAHLLGSTVGGIGVGGLLGGFGAALVALGAPSGITRPASAAIVLLGVATLAGALADARGPGRALPSWRRQVDERWLATYRGWVYGAGFGLQLGAGVVTIVPSALTYVALLAAVLTGDPLAGAVIGGTYGLVRALPLVLTARVTTPRALQAVLRGVDAASLTAARAGVAAQIVIGVLALSLAFVPTT